MSTPSTRLSDPETFQIVPGLWKGTRAPLVPATVVRSTNFRGDGLLDFSDSERLMVEARQLAERQLQPGDLIIERSGGGPKQPVGRVALFVPPTEERFATSNFTSVVRILDQKALDPAFVAFYLHHRYLRGETEHLQRATTGIRNLDWSEYLETEIPRLEGREQRQIAETLSFVRASYDHEERTAADASALKRAAMRELFTRGLRGEEQKESAIGLIPASWKATPFAEVREWLQYGTSARCTKDAAAYPVLRIPNVAPGRVDTSDLKYCDMSDAEADRYLLQPGDILFIRTNGVVERLGGCAVFSGEAKRALFASYLIRARLKSDRINSRYAAYFFESERGTREATSRATPAADGKYNLNTSAIDSFLVPLPPDPAEQREIVEILDAIDQKVDLHKRKKVVLEELFKALLHKLMTGEIRVADLELSALSDSSRTAEIERGSDG